MGSLKHRLDVRFRRYTSAWRTTPDFVIVGGMKCGTTALFDYLIRHPRILGATRKEVHFFDSNFGRGVSWYRQFFPLRLERGDRVVGEASPYYLFHPAAARRMRETVPHAKLIALLRNPVDRAYSHYQHTKRKGFESLTFEQAVAQEAERLEGEEERLDGDAGYRSRAFAAHSYVARGLYRVQLERYLRYFDPGQMLILKSEDFFADPGRTVNQVASFLGLPAFDLGDVAPKNRAEYTREPTPVHYRLGDYFRPHNEALYALLGVRYEDWDAKYAVQPAEDHRVARVEASANAPADDAPGGSGHI